MRWTRTVALAGLCALAVAACGSSSHKTAASVPSATATTTTGAQATTAATTTAQTTTGAPTTTTTPAAVQQGLCRAAALHLSFLGGQAATGHGLLGFGLRNVSASSCHTFGYPGILFLDRAGGPLPTTTMRTTQDFFGTAPLRSLTVAPGQTVSFRIGVTHFGPNGGGNGCATAYGLQVIPPNDTSTMHVAIGGGGAYECQNASLSPVQPDTSAYP
jgi:hypothetical protein